jgi:hypothetical protein
MVDFMPDKHKVVENSEKAIHDLKWENYIRLC